jgi:hypothetical protein
MQPEKSGTLHAPVFIAIAFFVFGLAILEKVLNVFGAGIPFTNVFPRQLLDWAVALLVFDIALTLRQLLEARVGRDG